MFRFSVPLNVHFVEAVTKRFRPMRMAALGREERLARTNKIRRCCKAENGCFEPILTDAAVAPNVIDAQEADIANLQSSVGMLADLLTTLFLEAAIRADTARASRSCVEL